jgi:arsenite methyltransferase
MLGLRGVRAVFFLGGGSMAAQRDWYIDIDRESDREAERLRTRPVGVPAASQSASPLWPAPPAAPARRDPREVGTSPLGMVPVEPGASVTRPAAERPSTPPAHLAASLAALHPTATASRPLTLADALAPVAIAPSSPSSLVDGEAAPEIQPAPLAEAPLRDWRSPDGVYHISVVAEAPLPAALAGKPEDYLTHRYDFARPAVAELYDRLVVPLWSAPFGRLLLSTFQSFPRQPGWQVVDVGCGTGYPTLEVARLLGEDGDVAGLDVWSAGIDRARARAEAARLPNVTFLIADVAGCDLPEQAFDVALCNLGLTNFARPEAALKGIARLLQPNGTLILTTSTQGTMQEFFETYRGVLNDLGLIDLSWDVERLMHIQPTLDSTEALLDLAGFTVDQTISDHFALEFPDGSTFLRSPLVGLSFLQLWGKVIRDPALRQVIFHEIERRLNARAAAWGRLDLIVPMLCMTARRRAD